MRRPPFKPWIVLIPSYRSRQDAPNVTDLSTTDTERSLCMRRSIPPPVASTAKPLPAIPAASSSPFCKRSYPCAPLGNRFTSSSTISPRTKPRRSVSSSNNTRESGFTSRPLTHPGSTRSRSGSPRSNARSSPAASSPRFPTWLANSDATSTHTPPMLGRSSGNTLTPPAASAVTNSLRQATRI